VGNNKIRLILVLLLALWMSASPLGPLFLQSVQAEIAQDNVVNMSINGQPVTNVSEERFKIQPIVRISSLSNLINKSSDGLVEIYLENSNENDVPLTVEINITSPQGTNVYGQGFGETQTAGVLHAEMGVPPGTIRTAYINIKAEKTGNFFAEFSGKYYPGANKHNYQFLSFTYPFSVYELSPDPKQSILTNPNQIPGNEGGGWKDKIVQGIIIIIVAGLIGLGYKIVDIKYQHKMEIKNRISRSKVSEKDGKITNTETSESKSTENK
jgi:hypothetical protein